MTIEGVAARAGVAKSTIYRHWESKAALIESAIHSMPSFADRAPSSEHDDLRSRVVRHLGLLEAALHGRPWGDVLPSLIHAAHRHPEVREIQDRFSAERRAVLRSVVADGVARGELPRDADIETLTSALAGPLFLARLMQNTTLGADGIERLVAAVLPDATGHAEAGSEAKGP